MTDETAAGSPDEPPEESTEDAAGIRSQRLTKLARLRAAGVNPYPYRFDRDRTLGELRASFAHLGPGDETEVEVRVAGRIMLKREQGRLTFVVIHDRDGEVQLFVSQGVLGKEAFAGFNDLDRGDWVGVVGTVMVTKKGELSVKPTSYELLGKALRPLPDKWKGLSDIDQRYRQRYVDLVVNEDARATFLIRSRAVQALRHRLGERGYLEVETPVLSLLQGGATARPFVTHYNALDLDTYLRIALELPLKRLIVGGMEAVFEIGRVFRNEGIDTRHNPEFTMLETYEAFVDYTDMMLLVEDLVSSAARAAIGTTTVTVRGREIDLAPPYRRATMLDLIKEHAGVAVHPDMAVTELHEVLDGLGIGYDPAWGSGRLVAEIYEERVEAELIEPTFVMDYPREISPLAKAHREDGGLVERFELVLGGHELANAYSELNDPLDQLARFHDEAAAKAAGDAEAGDVDLDYVRALEYGMPPTGGMGMGIDRLIMILAQVESIREVILFPTLRPEAGLDEDEFAVPADPLRPVRHTTLRARVIGWLTALGGLLLVLSVLPFVPERIVGVSSVVAPFGLRVASHVVSLLVGVMLLFLAGQLGRRKHRAWQVGIVLFTVSFLANVVRLDRPVAGVFSLFMVVLLVLSRREFQAPPDPPTLFQFLRFVPLYLGAVVLYGLVFLFTQRHKVSPPLEMGRSLDAIFSGLIGLPGSYDFQSEFAERVFRVSLLGLGVVGVITVLALLFRPIVARPQQEEGAWEHASRLVHTYGSDTLAYFALRDDKSFFFSSDAEAMIAYTYIGRYALASGDPIGRPESLELVIDEFLAMCHQRAWGVAFLATLESRRDVYLERGLHTFYLGDEAVVGCRDFSLKGKKWKSVRQSAQRIERTFHFEYLAETDASPELIHALNALSAKWRGKAPERGFTMSLSRDVDGTNPEFRLCVALDEQGQPGGFLRIVPIYGDERGYTLDLMRRDPDTPNGMTEFLLTRTLMHLDDLGFERLSMNFAVWGRLFYEDIRYSLPQRICKQLLELVNPFYQIKSLKMFNQRFYPEWVPRVIVYDDVRALPRVGLLYGGVEGFLSIPVIGRYFLPKTVPHVKITSPTE